MRPQAMRDFLARQKMGRMCTAEEVAHLCVYLAADEVGVAPTKVNHVIWHWGELKSRSNTLMTFGDLVSGFAMHISMKSAYEMDASSFSLPSSLGQSRSSMEDGACDGGIVDMPWSGGELG